MSVKDPHWIVYLQENTPNYIIEAKQRLGQIKQPHLAPPFQILNKQNNEKPTSPSITQNNITNTQQPIITEKPGSQQSKRESIKPKLEKHWLVYENPSTPDNIKTIRQRLGDDRYRKFDLTKNLADLSLTRSKKIIDSNSKTQNVSEEKKDWVVSSSVMSSKPVVSSENKAEQNELGADKFSNILPANEQFNIEHNIVVKSPTERVNSVCFLFQYIK